MKSVLEIHILQNFAPSNLNRDDTGSPKDAFFGGVRRARISSQSLKRAMRQYFQHELPHLLPMSELAKRSKRFIDELSNKLENFGEDAEWVAEAVLTLHGIFFVEEKADEATDYEDRSTKSEALAFLGNQFLDELALLLLQHENQSLAAGTILKDYRQSKRKARDYKGSISKEDKKNLPKKVGKAFGEISGQVEELIDGYKAVDVALFGRMIADLPKRNADAAAQVAHALGTGKAEREFDFYTAVDDLKPDDTAGADMLGTVEFVSATYYRYANLDLEQLRANLQGDTGLLLRGVEAFLRASIFAAPSGKQNTFAAHNLPSFVGFTVRRNASPRNLANAFETPVTGTGLVEKSLDKLAAEWAIQDQKFGQGGQTKYLATVKVPALPDAQEAANVEALIASTLGEVRSALGLADAAD